MILNGLDIGVLIVYTLILLFVAYWVSREKQGHEKNANDYPKAVLRIHNQTPYFLPLFKYTKTGKFSSISPVWRKEVH